MYSTTKQSGKIFSAAWSPDSQRFATGSLDGSVAVWCLDTKFDKSNSHYEKCKFTPITFLSIIFVHNL